MKICLRPAFVFALCLLPVLQANAADSARYKVTVEAGDRTRINVPICIDIAVPIDLAQATQATIKLSDGRQLAAQVTAPSLLAKSAPAVEGTPRQLCFVLDKLDKGKSISGEASIANSKTDSASATKFAWVDTPGKYTDLTFGDRPLLRYMYEPLDESSPERRAETYKVYHPVFSPDGKQIVTKGPGGLFPHHRGLYYGFNKITYEGGKKKADTWHCTNDAFESHDGFVASEVGPVLGRHRVAVGWHGPKKEVFAKEDREMTVYQQATKDGKPTGTLIEFASRLRPELGDVSLKGDPQHAGFQFRASNEVAESTKDKTYYLRVDGIGKPGDYRNWPEQKDQVNFPWKGMSFVVGGERYTVANLDRPQNPKESRFSERDYARFGSYFEYALSKDKPLEINYRIWIQPGEMTTDEIAALAADFTDPPRATAVRLP